MPLIKIYLNTYVVFADTKKSCVGKKLNETLDNSEHEIDKMAQADSMGPEALLKASNDCKLRLIRLLVDGGTQVNVRNSIQETPLILACKSENTEKEKVVEFLIKHRVKMNLQDVDGKTALMHACLTNSSDNLIRMLVNAKANPWVKDDSKNTAFDYAINAGNIGSVKVMIQACREGKMLSKPGSFNMEMKRLEDKLDQMPETRKCSWPLMGPRHTASKEKKVSQQSELLAVDEDDETESPTRERRRKKSICHFDPIDIDFDNNTTADATTERFPKPLRQGSLYSVGRSASSEEERISLHFSDSDNSSFDRSSAHFSSLEKLLRPRDSVTSSLESNDSLNVQTPTSLKLDMVWNLEKQKHQLTSHDEEKSVSTSDIEDSKTSHNTENSPCDADKSTVKTELKTSTQNTGVNRQLRRLNFQQAKSNNNVLITNDEVKVLFSPRQQNESPLTLQEKHLPESTEHPSHLPLREKLPSPSVSRRKTIGSLSGGKDDAMESGDSKQSGSEATTVRRFTVSTMEGSSGMQLTEVSSLEIKLNRTKIRPLEVDIPSKQRTKRNSLDTLRSSKKRDVNSKADFTKPINLPIISKPDDGVKDNGPKLLKCNEKTSVRRTLSDSICQSKRPNVATRHDNRLGVSRSEYFADKQPLISSSSPMQKGYRERSASSPLAPPESPQAERRASLSIRCDVTSSCRDAQRSRSPRYMLSGDLPDLVLHSPPRNRSPGNLDFQGHDQLPLQRTCRSISPEVLGLVSPVPGSPNHTNIKSNSYSHLPEVIKSTTGSPKEKRVALLPPLNISRKPNDAEEGYFSCSPSPLDIDSPNRGKEKSRYSFKPLSPRLVTRTVEKSAALSKF